jgi:hypothetical protein
VHTHSGQLHGHGCLLVLVSACALEPCADCDASVLDLCILSDELTDYCAELCSNHSQLEIHGLGTIALKAQRHEARLARFTDEDADVKTPATSSTVKEQMPATIGAPLDLRRLSFEPPATGDAEDGRTTPDANALLSCFPQDLLANPHRVYSDSAVQMPVQRGKPHHIRAM